MPWPESQGTGCYSFVISLIAYIVSALDNRFNDESSKVHADR